MDGEITEKISSLVPRRIGRAIARRTGSMASSAPSPVLAPSELLDDDAPGEANEK
jgi:hypothetical protein